MTKFLPPNYAQIRPPLNLIPKNFFDQNHRLIAKAGSTDFFQGSKAKQLIKKPQFGIFSSKKSSLTTLADLPTAKLASEFEKKR